MQSNPIKKLSGLFDKFIVEHGSAVVHEKHIALLKNELSILSEKFSLLESENENLKSENSALKNENINLKQKIQSYNEAPKPIFHDNLLWLPDDPKPFCPVCHETRGKLIHMHDYKFQDMVGDDIQIKPMFRCPNRACFHMSKLVGPPSIEFP